MTLAFIRRIISFRRATPRTLQALFGPRFKLISITLRALGIILVLTFGKKLMAPLSSLSRFSIVQCGRARRSLRSKATPRVHPRMPRRPMVCFASSRCATNFRRVCTDIYILFQSFWSPSSSALIANINVNDGRSGLDVNTILGVIHTFE